MIYSWSRANITVADLYIIILKAEKIQKLLKVVDVCKIKMFDSISRLLRMDVWILQPFQETNKTCEKLTNIDFS